MALTSDQVRHIARLARLALDSAELKRLGGQLQSILDYVARIEELPDRPAASRPEGEPEARPAPSRVDEPRASLTEEEALANAPDADAGHFRVPRVLRE
jgi:aspartyl-tRNA(Asn)/glutamyl-tRNA(Gln) amidotransferase subunit C